ncbi:MAG: M48 family metalloprotease [Pseudomonadota bacterium]
MRFLGTLCSMAACVCAAAQAQVPETGRWQELSFDTRAVNDSMAGQYHALLADYRRTGRLDDDRAVLQRVRRIAAGMHAAAVALAPQARHWRWEVHTSSDPDLDAICMAGGKLLVGSRFVRRLALRDGELAVLIAHEMAHAVAEHHRETLSEALHFNPQPATTLEVTMARLDSDLALQLYLRHLSHFQEREADQLGMVIAHRAGWPSAGFLSFYRKLAREEAPTLIASHPSAASRLSMAKGMARLFAASQASRLPTPW